MYWKSPVASANLSITSWVMVNQSPSPSTWPEAPLSASRFANSRTVCPPPEKKSRDKRTTPRGLCRASGRVGLAQDQRVLAGRRAFGRVAAHLEALAEHLAHPVAGLEHVPRVQHLARIGHARTVRGLGEFAGARQLGAFFRGKLDAEKTVADDRAQK